MQQFSVAKVPWLSKRKVEGSCQGNLWPVPVAGNELYVMGSNVNGQLGSGGGSSNVPIPIGSGIWPSGSVTIVAAGLQHTAVVAGVGQRCAHG